MATTAGSGDVKDHNLVEYIDEIDKDYRHNVNAQIRNPLSELTSAELESQVTAFCQNYGFTEKEQLFQKAALVAQRPDEFDNIAALTEDDRHFLRRETTRKAHILRSYSLR
jgi:hypothetical protein